LPCYNHFMTTVLIPGRHIITTAFMDSYLTSLLKNGVQSKQIVGDPSAAGSVTHIVIPITSANQNGSRYNPVPLYARIIDLERTMAQYREEYNIRVTYVPIPHVSVVDNFPEFLLKHAASHLGEKLTPTDAVVWCSTEPLIDAYLSLGFGVLPAEWNIETRQYDDLPPNQVLEGIVSHAENYQSAPNYTLLSNSTKSLWRDMPEIPDIRRY